MKEDTERMALNCLACGCEIEFPSDERFGGEVTCSKCQAAFTVEWDYVNDESMAFWLEGAAAPDEVPA